MTWGSKVEIERRKRIKLSVAAFAYEYLGESFMSDHDFDQESLLVDLTIDTGNKEMDEYFREHFDPCTGMWVVDHPNALRLKQLYEEYYR